MTFKWAVIGFLVVVAVFVLLVGICGRSHF